MKFDRSKVVDGLCDNLEQWIGYEGYFADSVQILKNYVERDLDNKSTFVEVEKNRSGFFYFRNSDDDTCWLFYPANPPERKKKLVPFDNCQELIEWYCEREDLQLSKNQMPSIWVRFRDSEVKSLITDFYIDSVRLESASSSLKGLFDGYKLLDGTPIGKEERK